MLFVRDFLDDQIIRRHPAGPTAPTVSVILPTYRRCVGGYLQRAINSVLSQTYSDFELLVMDDGSTDGSAELIEAFQARDPRVVHVRHERNSGLPALRANEGIELARGRYVAFMFDDDVWRPIALEKLITEAERLKTDGVIVGQSLLSFNQEQITLPGDEIMLHTLNRSNQLTNNSVLVPRVLFEQYGMYDCHIGMRRLCDWDLWLRFIRHVPFHVVRHVISETTAGNPHAIGVTVPYDLALFRYWHDIPRNHLLTPTRWRDYSIDDLRIGNIEIAHDFRRRLYEEHIVPFYLKHRHQFPVLEGFSVTPRTTHKTCLYIRNWYEPTHEIAFNHYDPITVRRGTYKSYYQQVTQVSSHWIHEADELLLCRSLEDESVKLLAQACENQVPVAYYLDDDLLTFYEYGHQFDYLAPGTPLHNNLIALLKDADGVWCTNRFIATSVSTYNSRLISHNGCVPEAWLPQQPPRRDPNWPLRIGYVGTGYRLEEFQLLWEALQRLSAEHSDQLIFEFWGIDVSSLPPLHSPVIQRPYISSYLRFIRELQAAQFDILLTPLLAHPRPRLGKAPSKYYQAAVAGAFGIFSDVPQYEMLPHGLTCLKAENTVESWYAALKTTVTMPLEEFDRMRWRLIEHVREAYTETAQIHLHEAAWRATEFHALTRAARHADGRPRVIYVIHSVYFGGGETQLWRRLRLARTYGIEPIVVLPRALQGTDAARSLIVESQRDGLQVEFVEYECFTEPISPTEYHREAQRQEVRALLERYQPALVHTVTFIPTFGQICAELGVPHVASLYAVDDNFTWPQGRPEFRHADLVQSDSIRYARRWGELLGVEHFCSREMVPEEVFNLGTYRYLEQLGQAPAPWKKPVKMLVSGTIQPRKRQAEIIEAVGRLAQEGWDCHLDLLGYTHFFPDYLEQCHQNIRKYGLEGRVTFHGFSKNVLDAIAATDIVLSLSTYESFPSAIKEAMAAGVLVVATPVGGTPELIIDEVSGILCADTSVDALVAGIRRALQLTPEARQRIVQQARRVARSEFHPQRVANDLLTMYVLALSKARQVTCRTATPVGQRSPTATSPSAAQIITPTVPPQGYVRIGGGVRYRLQAQHPHWCGVEVLILTQQRPVSGTLRLRVYGARGQLLRETAVNLTQARDQEWLRLSFEPIANSAHESFELEFTIMDPGPGQVVGLFESNPLEPLYKRGLRRLGIPLAGNTLYCKLWYSPLPSR